MKPLMVDNTKVKTKPNSTASVKGVSVSDFLICQISQANQACEATKPTAATAIKPNNIACHASRVL